MVAPRHAAVRRVALVEANDFSLFVQLDAFVVVSRTLSRRHQVVKLLVREIVAVTRRARKTRANA